MKNFTSHLSFLEYLHLSFIFFWSLSDFSDHASFVVFLPLDCLNHWFGCKLFEIETAVDPCDLIRIEGLRLMSCLVAHFCRFEELLLWLLDLTF